MIPSKLLCGHENRFLAIEKNRATCKKCSSFWDLDYYGNDYVYNEKYPELGRHFDEDIGQLKIRSLKKWLTNLSLGIEQLTICDVGFGTGYCLNYIQQNAAAAYGIEAIQENIDFANKLGVIKSNLFLFDKIPDKLSQKIDLWLFQDSFEHLIDPSAFIVWLAENSSPRSKILIIAPRSDSISQKLMGKYWIHKNEDHRFHWSKKGIVEFFEQRGYVLQNYFYPVKYVSTKMVFLHLARIIDRTGLSNSENITGKVVAKKNGIVFPLNFGEMGLLFSKR